MTAGRGYITKSRSGHYTAKAVNADGRLIAISDKLPSLDAARAFNRDALNQNSTNGKSITIVIDKQ
jgi:hypothetical protein